MERGKRKRAHAEKPWWNKEAYHKEGPLGVGRRGFVGGKLLSLGWD